MIQAAQSFQPIYHAKMREMLGKHHQVQAVKDGAFGGQDGSYEAGVCNPTRGLVVLCCWLKLSGQMWKQVKSMRKRSSDVEQSA